MEAWVEGAERMEGAGTFVRSGEEGHSKTVNQTWRARTRSKSHYGIQNNVV